MTRPVPPDLDEPVPVAQADRPSYVRIPAHLDLVDDPWGATDATDATDEADEAEPGRHRLAPTAAVVVTSDPQPVPRRRSRLVAWVAVAAGVVALLVVATTVILRPESDRGATGLATSAPSLVGPATGSEEATASPSAAPTPSLSPPGPTVSPTRAPAATTPPGAAGAPPPSAAGPTAGTANRGPITAYSACESNGTGVFTATFTVSFDWRHVFIDTDQNAATGYQVPDLARAFGADYMVENETLYRSTDTEWAWQRLSGSPLVAHTGGLYTWRVSRGSLGSATSVLRAVFNGSGTSPEASSPILTVGACSSDGLAGFARWGSGRWSWWG
jgi:hypothetical protein